MTLPPDATWFTAAELADLRLPGFPNSRRGVQMHADRHWMDPRRENQWWRQRKASGGGLEYHFDALPAPAQAALLMMRAPAPEVRQARDARAAGLWSAFERRTEKQQLVARQRLPVMIALADMMACGISRMHALRTLSRQTGVTISTLYAWEQRCQLLDRCDWLPALAPTHTGALGPRAECDEPAWDYLRADYLRPERPSFEACWRRLNAVAEAHGWTMPSQRTMRRRLAQLPRAVATAAREGSEALRRAYPAQERTRAHLHALEAVNGDGHKWDVFVKWPDGTVGRPMMIAFQDLYSGKLLSWRVDRAETSCALRLAFGDLVDQYGIPEHLYLDNGRANASKWLSGGSVTRYRFKILEDEPQGLFTALGVQMHWTTPYAGQSKPIERAFGDLAGDLAKHPAFAGAYTGNATDAKPENYQSAAVPLETFLRVIGEGIAEHNARAGRRGGVCAGRSFDAVFAESYAASPIRRATEAQRRLWLMAAERMRASPRDGSITVLGNRFWSEFLAHHAGERLTVRFDPDALQDDLHVYAQDGRYLGAAPVLEAVGFTDLEAARAHARARKAWMRGVKMQLEAERKLSAAELAAMIPQTAKPEPPERRVVRPFFGGAAALARQPDEFPEQSEAEIALLRGMQRALRLVAPEEG